MLGHMEKKSLVNYHIASRRERLTTYEGYDFAFAPTGKPPPTAWWGYDVHRHRHNIVFSEDVDTGLDRPLAGWGTWRTKRAFLEKVYDHEGAHSLWTERDHEKRKAWKVPHLLVNLFEDARIEAQWRKEFHRRFHWLRYCLTMDEKPPPTPDPTKGIVLVVSGGPISAINLFLDCIMMENSPKLLQDWIDKDKDPKVQFEGKKEDRWKFGRRYIIRYYYRRAIKAGNTAGLVPIIKSWMKTFPETAAPMVGVIGLGPGGIDMPEGGDGTMPSHAIDPDGSKHKEIKETVTHKSGTARGTGDSYVGAEAAEEKEEEYHHEGTGEKVKIPYSEFFSKRRQRTMDHRRADSLIRLFERFLEGGEGIVHTRNPSSRIDMRQLLRGSENIYLRKGDDPYGVKDISFIMDCSGSMSRALEDGVYLAYVLNELVRHRKIQCRNMIVCGGRNQAVPMPFDPRILDYLQAPGSIEGFAHAMREHEKELVASDLTIFFTDGSITDELIVKEYWHRKGVYSIGLFVGDPSRSASLHRWFDSVLVRNDIEMVADSLIQLIKRQ